MGHPNCQAIIFMGLTDPHADRYHQHSMVLVPMQTPGVKVERMLEAMGFLDAPGGHGEVSFTDVRLPASAIIGGAGQAFAIAQARLGPGRIHHCMRLIGLAELALELGLHARERAHGLRQAAGQPRRQPRTHRRRSHRDRPSALARAARGLACRSKSARGDRRRLTDQGCDSEHGPSVVDMAIQLHGGGGLSNDFPLAGAWTAARALRLADGPDEVHRGVVARLELARYGKGKWSG